MQDLREILASINDAVWSFDLISNRFIYVNKKLEELFETSNDQLEQNVCFWLRYVHPEDYPHVSSEIDKLDRERTLEIEYRLLINNEVKWVHDKKVLIYDDSKTTSKGIISIITDISSKKLSESQLTDTQKIYRYLFINNPNPLWIYDKKTLRFLAVNHAAMAVYGYSGEEFLNMTIADIRPAEDVEELLNYVYSVKNTFSPPKKYWRHLKKNGELIYVNISGHGIHHNGHDAEIVMAHDITSEVESRKKITLAKENLDALINNIEDDIWSIDKNYRLISANNSYRKNLGEVLGREVIIGESVFVPEYTAEDKKQWRNYYDRAFKGESFTFTEFNKHPERAPFFAETKLNPIRDKNKIIGVACISRNIQDKLDAQNRIIEQNVKLREVISLASHEIRGPVATLLGLIAAFNKDNPTDPFNEEVMALITDVTNNLDTVLHKLVDKSYSLKEEAKVTTTFQYNQSVSE